MPVVVASASRSADALISYALDDKPDQQGERYVMASGVGGLLVSVAKQQMRDVRKKWGKDKPGAFVQAYHVIESFAKDELAPDDPDSWMTAQKLGHALAEDRFPGRHALIVTQRDGKTGCVHNHIVVNSIDTKTGRSLNSSVVMHARLVEAHERVLEAERFEQRADLKQAFSDATERRERGEPSGLRRAGSTEQSELREFQQHILWETECDIADEFGAEHNPEPFSLTVLKSRIELALEDPSATDWDAFVQAGRVHGVRIEQRGKKGRGISYGMLREQSDGTVAEPSPSDRRRCSSLGADFEMNAVEQALVSNSAAQAQAVVAPVAAPAAQLTPAARQDKPAPRKPSPKERMQAALDEAAEEGNAISQAMIADYLKAKALVAQPLTSKHAPYQSEQTVTVHVSDDLSPSLVAEHQEAQEAPPAAPETVAVREDVKKDSEPQTVSTDAEKLRSINARNRRLGLPSVSPDQYAAKQAMTPEHRKLRQKHPELFDDAEPTTNPSWPSPSLGE